MISSDPTRLAANIFLGLILMAPFFLFAFGVIDAKVFAVVLGGAIYLALLLVNFTAGFLTLLFVRSSLDYIKETTGGVNVAAAASVGLIVLSLFYVLFKRINILDYEDSKPFLIFLGATCISTAFSWNLVESVIDLLRLFSVFSVYILTRSLFQSIKQIRFVFVIILLSSLIPVLLGYYQLLSGSTIVSKGFEYGRLYGTFSHPNAYATYLLVILVFCATQLFEGETLISKKLIFLFLGAVFVVFILTYSRGAWIVFVFTMGFMGMMRYRKLLLLMPVGLVLMVVVFPSVLERFQNILQPSTYSGQTSAWEWRLRHWEAIIPLIHQNPFFGIGPGVVKEQVGYLAHNDYIRMVAETGFVGFLTYLYFAYRQVKITWLQYLATRSRLVKGILLGVLTMMLGFLVRETADNTMRHTVILIYFWSFVALARNLALFYAQNPPEKQAAPL